MLLNRGTQFPTTRGLLGAMVVLKCTYLDLLRGLIAKPRHVSIIGTGYHLLVRMMGSRFNYEDNSTPFPPMETSHYEFWPSCRPG